MSNQSNNVGCGRSGEVILRQRIHSASVVAIRARAAHAGLSHDGRAEDVTLTLPGCIARVAAAELCSALDLLAAGHAPPKFQLALTKWDVSKAAGKP